MTLVAPLTTGLAWYDLRRDRMIELLEERFQLPSTTARLHVDSLVNRAANRLAADHHVDVFEASKIIDQALVFVATCAMTDKPIGPSEQVDWGWHTLLLYSAEYWAFSVASGATDAVPHWPEDLPGRRPHDISEYPLNMTVAEIEKAGFRLRPDLWPGLDKCSSCGRACGKCRQRCKHCRSAV